MQIKTFYFNPLRTCCYLLWDESRECVIIDAGCADDNEAGRLRRFIAQENLKPLYLLATHAHFDHIMGNAAVQNTWNIPCLLHPYEEQNLQRAVSYASFFDIDIAPLTGLPLKFIGQDDVICFGDTRLKVIFCPGHSQGHLAYYHKDSQSLFSGDCLFQGSIGRTDLPGGNYDVLMNSLNQNILSLGPDVCVYPGHGPSTTIAEELQQNPFLR